MTASAELAATCRRVPSPRADPAFHRARWAMTSGRRKMSTSANSPGANSRLRMSIPVSGVDLPASAVRRPFRNAVAASGTEGGRTPQLSSPPARCRLLRSAHAAGRLRARPQPSDRGLCRRRLAAAVPNRRLASRASMLSYNPASWGLTSSPRCSVACSGTPSAPSVKLARPAPGEPRRRPWH